jgi:hypothetical protein
MSLNKIMVVMIAGVAAYTINESFSKDVLAEINVCDACRCSCIRRKRIIVE